MDQVFACAAGWAPFSDPNPVLEEPELVIALHERVNDWLSREQEQGRAVQLHSSGFETSDNQLKRILRRMGHNIENSFQEWVEWVNWRRGNDCNNICEDNFKERILPTGIAEWRGEDREGRPTLQLTGRNLTLEWKDKRPKEFKRFVIYMAEKGVHLLNEKGLETACVCYDRRMLDYEHCDTSLHAFCKNTFRDVRRFYGDRIGKIYILNMNWLFWWMFSWLFKPIIGIWNTEMVNKIHAVQTKEELFSFYEQDRLELDDSNLDGTSATTGTTNNNDEGAIADLNETSVEMKGTN